MKSEIKKALLAAVLKLNQRGEIADRDAILAEVKESRGIEISMSRYTLTMPLLMALGYVEASLDDETKIASYTLTGKGLAEVRELY